MQINIKLKFLQEQKANKSIEVVRLLTKQDTLRNYLSKRRTVNLNNQTNEDIEAQTYNMQSFRQHREKSIVYNRDTPRQAYTHRYSKSKEIKLSKSKKINHQQHEESRNKTILFKKKKEQPASHIRKNISQLLTKPNDRPKKQQPHPSRTNFVQDTFTGKFLGVEGKKVLKQYSQYLTEIERVEIINEKAVYYIGLKNKIHTANEDDLEGNYLWTKHDHIGYRYELIERLGSGSFGDVIKAYDHKSKQFVALKIIKSKKEHFQLALNQINILMLIKQNDLQSEKNCVKIKDFIVFRKHMCIVFELLSLSLYELLKLNQFEGIRMDFIRRFAIQLLNALAFLKKLKIIHSDIKPENILLKSKSKTGIKLIDFGTSMHSHENSFDYIQSRYYRAPEVILGHPYSISIDMWSTGCVLAELYLGLPLFAGDNEQQQLSLIFQALGVPNSSYLQSCTRSGAFFHSNLQPKIIKTADGKVLMPESKPIHQRIHDTNFLDFLMRIFVWDINARLTPLEALMHPWILEGLPQDIKKQHVFYIKEQIKKETVQDTQEEAPATSRRKRVKRSSELCQSSKKDKKHTRRRSDGMP